MAKLQPGHNNVTAIPTTKGSTTNWCSSFTLEVTWRTFDSSLWQTHMTATLTASKLYHNYLMKNQKTNKVKGLTDTVSYYLFNSESAPFRCINCYMKSTVVWVSFPIFQSWYNIMVVPIYTKVIHVVEQLTSFEQKSIHHNVDVGLINLLNTVSFKDITSPSLENHLTVTPSKFTIV